MTYRVLCPSTKVKVKKGWCMATNGDLTRKQLEEARRDWRLMVRGVWLMTRDADGWVAFRRLA